MKELDLIDVFKEKLLNLSSSWGEAKILVESIEKNKKIKKIDDFIIGFFEGSNKLEIQKYKNKKLISTFLLAFVWHRVHRLAFYDSAVQGGFYPLDYQISKLEGILKRVAGACGYDCPLYKTSLFIVKCLRHEYDDAYKLINGIQYPRDGYMFYYFKGIYSFEISLPLNQGSAPSVPFDFSSLKDFGNRGVFVVSCDQKYYDQFHLKFLSTARNIDIDNTICFFVIGDKSGYEYFSENNYYVIHIQSHMVLSPAFYASARYLYAFEMLKQKKCEVFVFDIDFDFSLLAGWDFSSVLGSDFSLSFNKYGRSFIPWSHISAAVSYFSSSDSSLFFLQCFSAYFQKNYSPNKWWIDQNSLFFAMNKTVKVFPEICVKNMIEFRDLGCSNNNGSVIEFKRNNASR